MLAAVLGRFYCCSPAALRRKRNTFLRLSAIVTVRVGMCAQLSPALQSFPFTASRLKQPQSKPS